MMYTSLIKHFINIVIYRTRCIYTYYMSISIVYSNFHKSSFDAKVTRVKLRSFRRRPYRLGIRKHAVRRARIIVSSNKFSR